VLAALAFVWVIVVAVIPFAVYHHVFSDIIVSFHWSFGYLVGELSPWFLLLAGVVFMVPVAFSAGRDPESRLYPRARRAYFAWGTVLYLLGLGLTVQVAELWSFAH
jgi:hypothetical protein